MTPITLNRYSDGKLTIPMVVDALDFENCAALDVIILKGERFSIGQELDYLGKRYLVIKLLKEKKVNTDLLFQDIINLKRCRYFCKKL